MPLTKRKRRLKIKKRIRKRINGTADRPRMSVYRSNKHISVQLIDDVNGNTLVSASSLNKEVAGDDTAQSKTDKSKKVGHLIADKAKEAGIEKVVFDRNGFKYHGRLKALADAAREEGLKF